MIVTFLGIKNDSQRTGFQVTLPPSADSKTDPVEALRTYSSRTDYVRCSVKRPAFLSLTRPFSAISASTVSHVLQESITAAEKFDWRLVIGPKTSGSTGATRAFQLGFDTDDVQRLGRWKTGSVFLEHYVHTK